MKDDLNPGAAPESTRATDCPPSRGVGARTAVAALLTAAVLTAGGVVALRWFAGPQQATATEPADEVNTKKPSAQQRLLFREWPKPDFVFLLSGQQHGYVLPCGCSRPQLGGLERRYNFLKDLEKRGWPVVALDLGDILQKKGPASLPNVQGMIKYSYTMQALKKMGYAAVGFGEFDAALPLKDVLAEFAYNNYKLVDNKTELLPPFVIGSNLARKGDQIYENSTVTSAVVPVPATNLKVGVIGVVSPTVAKTISGNDQTVKFEAVKNTLDKLLPELDKVNLKVLLYQGSDEFAKKIPEIFPSLNVILCLSEEDEPSSRPILVKDTMIISVGHKGKHVGVVGVNAKNAAAKSFDLRYQMVTLDEDYLTPAEQEAAHPIVQLMEEYTKELKTKNYLAEYKQVSHPLQTAKPPAVPSFVGSERCEKCHQAAYNVWKATPHAHAYKTLVNDTRPSLRQYDGECIVCHTVGFGYKTGFESLEKTPKLINVGCESCHGPCSEHVKNPNNTDWHKLINPYKFDPEVAAKAKKGDRGAITAEKQRKQNLDTFCQKCHDQDNDVHWDVDLKWPKVEHHE